MLHKKAKFEFISIYEGGTSDGEILQNYLELSLFMKTTGLQRDSVIIKTTNGNL